MFELLRNMDAFTEDMFNRIIAFQEKEHPAWVAELPFEQRIADLPLHYLLFSNGDRDPAKYGPTVAPFYPLHWEILRFAHYIQQLGANARVCDIHCGNGFIGSLLGREGINIFGVREPGSKPNQIENFYDPERFQLHVGTLAAITSGFDVALSSWMPANINITPDILRHQPKLVIYIYTDHIDERTGQRQTGTDGAFDLARPYHLLDEWSVTQPENLLKEIWPDLTGNIEETRKVRIYGHQNYQFDAPATTENPIVGYDWEKELQLIETAHQAKALVKARGFPA